MSFRAWFKSRTADKVLSPVREMIIDRMETGSRVLEIGCGTGDLLFKASNKIAHGLGIDLDTGMIDFANNRKQQEQTENLEFVSEDLASVVASGLKRSDVSTSTLCLHEMTEQDACNTLELMARYSSKLIIADYGMARGWWAKVSIELDELISGHYRRFTGYRRRGGMPYLARAADLKILSVIDTPIDGIRIWELGHEQ